MLSTFKLAGKCCTASREQSLNGCPARLAVTQSQNHVIVVAHPRCLCDTDVSIISNTVRSAKCPNSGDVSIAHEELTPRELEATRGACPGLFAYEVRMTRTP